MKARVLSVHASHPQARLLAQAHQALASGGVGVCPSDATYLLVCGVDDKDALSRIWRVRGLDEAHPMTLVCRDVSQVSRYAKVDNPSFRLLKKAWPGPFTFILPSTGDVPRRLLRKGRTVGVRVSDHAVLQGLLALRDEPLVATTLRLPGDAEALSESDEVAERLSSLVEVILDAGPCGLVTTSVIDLTAHPPRVIREGKGDVVSLGLVGSLF
jgi:tRNA threonylcarbamoyl adenosine modification protein (Sua5/YciO/YrdC/YwlC family)